MKHSLIFLPVLFLSSGLLRAQMPEADAEGCKDSKLLKRMRGCLIVECSAKEFDSVEVQVGGNANEPKMKTLEGEAEILRYACPENLSSLQIARNAEGALRQAGFTIVYSGKSAADHPLVTGKGGAQWLSVETNPDGNVYIQTALKEKAMTQELELSADAMAEEINKSGHVAIYGINFDTAKASIKPESSAALDQVLKLLQANPSWKLRVEGHTDNVGSKAANQALSQQRAAAVVDWLVSKGIAKTRLAAQGFGDTKPIGENTSEEGRAKNRRVELQKM